MNENAKAVDVRAVLDCAAEQVITRAVCISSANRFGTAKQLRQASAISHRRCVMSRNEEAANRGDGVR